MRDGYYPFIYNGWRLWVEDYGDKMRVIHQAHHLDGRRVNLSWSSFARYEERHFAMFVMLGFPRLHPAFTYRGNVRPEHIEAMWEAEGWT